MKKYILITGGAGFIGSSLSNILLLNKFNVIIADDLSTSFKKNIPKHKNCKFIKTDVNIENKIANIFKKFKIEYVFHFAACVGVQRTLQNPLKVLKDIEGFKNIFNLSYRFNIKRIFFASSSEVYGEGFQIPQNEFKTPLNSRLPYAVIKNVGESFCKTYYQEYGLKYTIFRFFNTYGPRQSKNFVMSKFIDRAILNKNITIYGDGKQSRTFCYIDDTTDAILNCLEKKIYINDIVNIGNNKIINILNLANKIIQYSNSKSKIIHIQPLKEGDMYKRQPDIAKMKILLKNKYTSLRDGIIKTINYEIK